LVVFGDTLYDAPLSPARQVIDAYEKYGEPIIGLAEVRKEELNKFGVIDGEDLGDGNYKIRKFVEKPKPGKAPSNLVAVGLYVITPAVFRVLKKMKIGKSGEIRLADAFEIMLEEGKPLYGKKIEGEWLDTGSKFGFIKATIRLGMKDKEIGQELKKYIKNLEI
jgi:UTP--glucose-1-phosphate uridylyltransferase